MITSPINGARNWRQSVRSGAAPPIDFQEEMWRDSANRNIADDASPHTLEPHDCLQFPVDKEHRWIELKLIERVVPQQFEYIHILKERIPEKDWNLSPKRFRLFGKLEGGDWVKMEIKGDTTMGVGDNKVVLNFMESQQGIEYLRVEWDIHGDARSTRLYRLRIHGEPDGQWIEMELMQKMVPIEFMYVHIDKAVILEEERRMAPTAFILYGKVEGDWLEMEVTERRTMGVDQSELRLEFLSNQTAIDSMRIEWESGDAAKSRIYRLRVHGYPVHV